MRYTPFRLAAACLLGATLWYGLFYLVNALQWPALLSYGVFAGLSAALLYLLVHRFWHARQYALMFDKHPIPMWIYEYGTLRFLSVNQAAVEKYGYSKKEFQSMTIADIRERSEVNRLMENIRMRCAGAQYRGIWQHRKKDGSNFYVEIYAHDGMYKGRKSRVIMSVDVDAQVRETMEARELGLRYELLARATHDAIYDWNMTTNQVVWNHGLHTLFGYRNGRDIGTVAWWENKMHPDDRERVLTALRQRLESTESYFEVQYRLQCADNSYKYVLSRAYIMREHNTPVRMIGIMQDIDEHVQALHRLQEQNKGLREIAWMNSHEVRRPVVSILSIVQLFDKSHHDTTLNNQLIEWLQTSTSQLDEIIHKLEEKVRQIESGCAN